MQIQPFSTAKPGLIKELLCDAYSEFTQLVAQDKENWTEFDAFVFDNLHFMNRCGFLTQENGIPIGFISWDPRKIPLSVEIGHNCIIRKYQGQGNGLKQLAMGIGKIKELNPDKIIVKTGNIDFFIPAMKMYQAAGFTQKRIIHTSNDLVPEVIEFEIILK